jgi:protein involved in polysaccharide export with SLBB domain
MLLIALIALALEAYRTWEAGRSVIYVQGDVNFPGKVIVNPGMTVVDAFNAAGGLSPTAAVLNIRLVRPISPGARSEQVLPVNLPAIVNAKDLTTNYQLRSGDRLVVYRSASKPLSPPASIPPNQDEASPVAR